MDVREVWLRERICKRRLVETHFYRLKKILGEEVRDRSFEDVVRYVQGIGLPPHPHKQNSGF